MAFKDKLKELIDNNGGRTPENLSRIANLAREVSGDITQRYLTLLLLGSHPPRPKDYQALAVALGVLPQDFLDGPEAAAAEKRRRVKEFISRMDRADLAEPFLRYINKDMRFRNKAMTYDDLYLLFNQFLRDNYDQDDPT